MSTGNAPPKKRVSRSNSVSSSVATVKKSASLSSRSGPRSSYVRGRSSSPDSISRVLNQLNSSRSNPRSRPESAESRKPGSGLPVNRWSHSTSSSLSGLDTDLIKKRTSSSATRRSIAVGGQAYTSHPQGVQDSSSDTKASPSRRHVKRPSGSTHSVRSGSRLAFQDSSNLRVVQDLSQAPDARTGSDLFTSTWEQSGLNKFGEPVQGVSIQYIGGNHSNQSPNAARTSNTRARAEPKIRNAHLRRHESPPNESGSNGESGSSVRNAQSRARGYRSPMQKDMLSKALAQANNAVLLDNAQDVSGAIEAYNEACDLLEQVMMRSSDPEDRGKLSAIRATYSNRIAELHDLDNTFADLLDKELPDDPPSDEYDQPEDFYHEDPSFTMPTAEAVPTIQIPMRQESLLPEIFGGEKYMQSTTLPAVRNPLGQGLRLNVPMDAQYMPQPLSPRHPASSVEGIDGSTEEPDSEDLAPPKAARNSTIAKSWLNAVEGSAPSPQSSRTSSVDANAEDDQPALVDDAEFDAMNEAVDAAYEDELSQEPTPRVINRHVHLPSVEGLDDGSVQDDHDRTPGNRPDHFTGEPLDDDAEEEEKLLEEITQEFGILDTKPDQDSTNNIPRQSDSSGFSGRTWGSSVASTTATSGTALSTLAESTEPSTLRSPAPSVPLSTSQPRARQWNAMPSTEPISQIPQPRKSTEKHVGIRDRRMSGQTSGQLKIDTLTRRSSVSQSAKKQMKAGSTGSISSQVLREVSQPESKSNNSKTLNLYPMSLPTVDPLTPLTITPPNGSRSDPSPSIATVQQTELNIRDNNTTPSSPPRSTKMMPPPPLPLHKNVSSTSLKKASLSINTSTTDPLDPPMTPGSAIFPNELKRGPSTSTPVAPTPGGNVLTSVSSGGMYLFDDPMSANPSQRAQDGNFAELAPLEPCPESFLLRPFWLMRCMYQAFANPRGGYVTNKLFIPRDIWRVRNVKIKALDDKVSQCDLLTAALQKLAKVDTLDADAVLDELQSFEAILEQARQTLSKKLGSDVGLSGSASVFKASPAVEDSNESMSARSSNTSSAAKSIASGWRKLRSKSSSANLNSSSGSAPRDNSSNPFTMQSLPMTSSSSVQTSRSYQNGRSRHPPPTPTDMSNVLAPHAYYMSSLARLFDAVQILDSIARQVEDPGLKFSSKTHVGLELSVRNAAEFFAFYIIRFVMSDLLLLVDKFLKRGTEWIMT